MWSSKPWIRTYNSGSGSALKTVCIHELIYLCEINFEAKLRFHLSYERYREAEVDAPLYEGGGG
jgi:hypothetical protein